MQKIPFTPADPEPQAVPTANPLGDAAFCRMVIGSLLIKGGVHNLVFTQADLDAVAKLVLLSGRTPDGDFIVALGIRDSAGVVHPFDPSLPTGR